MAEKTAVQSLNKEQLLHAYRKMAEIRYFEDRVHIENQSGEIPGFIHLYAGQEAVAVGICENLRNTDVIGSTHRGHGHSIAKGCDLKGMMAEIFGRATGLNHGKGGSMHIADLSVGMLGANGIVGGAGPLAVGAAFTGKYKGEGNIGVAFSGDGGSNQGTIFESMNMAVTLKLPALFVFENNGFGEATGASFAVGSGDIAGRAAAFGMPAVKVDGTDFFAMHEVAKEAVERARRGEGPTAIEATAFRWYGHFEGDPGLYRTPEQLKVVREENDPLLIFRKNVGRKVSAKELDDIEADVEQQIEDAVEFAKNSPWPAPEELTNDVYVSY